MADAKDNALLSAIGIKGGLPKTTEDLLSLQSDVMLKESEAEAQKKKAEKLAQTKTEVELGKEYEKRLEEQKPYTERLMKQQEERPYPEPSKENFQEFATMFSVMSALTFAVGGKGRGAGMSAMAALNGAIDGYNKGRKDMFDRNMKEFDKKLAEYKASLESTRDALNIVIKQGDLKTERARALLKQAELNDAGIAAAEIQQGRVVNAVKLVNKAIGEASKAEARADKLKNSSSDRYGFGAIVATNMNEAVQSIENIVSLPETSTTGTFQGENTKGLLYAPLGNLANQLTSEDVQRYNTEISNFGKFVARVVSGGRVPPYSVQKEYDQTFKIRDGDKPLTVLTKLAQGRAALERAAEVYLAASNTDEGLKDIYRNALASIREAVPFTVQDVNRLANERDQKATFSDMISSYGLDKGKTQPKQEAPSVLEKNLSKQDQDALNWANKNPQDPRSSKIKKSLGM